MTYVGITFHVKRRIEAELGSKKTCFETLTYDEFVDRKLAYSAFLIHF